MKALVLGGGSILGAWEAGAARALFESGYEPDIIIGISVGGLNGAFIANIKGTRKWVEVGEVLTDFWKHNITCPSDVAIKRKKIPLIWSIIRNRFNGFTTTQPIDNLIDVKIHLENIHRSGIDLSVGAVNVNSGKISYVDSYAPNFKSYLKATKAIPFAMPVQSIGLQTYIDGGLIDSAPIGEAIRKKATEIVVLTPHPEYVGAAEVDSGNIAELGERCISIMLNNTLNNDLKMAKLINSITPVDGTTGLIDSKKYVPIKVIRPSMPLTVSLSTFTKEDILSMILNGMDECQRQLS